MSERCPEHDAMLFHLDLDHAETVLAADAVTQVLEAVERARRARGVEGVTRWALVVRAAVLRAPDRAGALVAGGMPPDAARRMAERIAPVLASTPIDTLAPDDWVAVANVHGVPDSERPVLVMLGALAVEAAAALRGRRDDGRLDAVVYLETPTGNPDGPWAGVVAAGLGTPELFDAEVRAVVSDLRARIVRHYPGAREWLAPGAVATIDVRSPEHHPGLPLAIAPFVVTDAGTRLAMAAGIPASVLDTDLLIDHPPRAH